MSLKSNNKNRIEEVSPTPVVHILYLILSSTQSSPLKMKKEYALHLEEFKQSEIF